MKKHLQSWLNLENKSDLSGEDAKRAVEENGYALQYVHNHIMQNLFLPEKKGCPYNNTLLSALSKIQSMCIGEITMGCKLDANNIGEMISEATGMNAEELKKHL